MNLKEIFEQAEGGVLNFEQFTKLATAANAKFVDLGEGKYVDKQKYTDDLASRDTRITELDNSLKSRDTDLENLQKQLQEAGTDVEKLNTVTSQFTELQKQYDKDTKAYQKQLADQAYKYAVNQFVEQHKFTSKAAKRDFTNALLQKGLQLDNDTIIGASDFVASYSQENEDAFLKEEPTSTPKPAPHFVEPTSPAGAPGGEINPFNFDFVGVRPHDTK